MLHLFLSSLFRYIMKLHKCPGPDHLPLPWSWQHPVPASSQLLTPGPPRGAPLSSIPLHPWGAAPPECLARSAARNLPKKIRNRTRPKSQFPPTQPCWRATLCQQQPHFRGQNLMLTRHLGYRCPLAWLWIQGSSVLHLPRPRGAPRCCPAA